MPWYFILKRQLETTNSNILPPSVLMMHICFQGDFGYIIVLLKNLLVLLVPLKHIIAKKETPLDRLRVIKAFFCGLMKQVVHFSFFLHKVFSYLAAITDIAHGRHHLPYSGKNYSSPSLSH